MVEAAESCPHVPLILRRIANRIGRPLGINPFPRAFEYALSAAPESEGFDTIFEENLWASEASRSGVGSEMQAAQGYRDALAKLIAARGFETLFDAPCGDLHWMPSLLARVPIHYLGGDISHSVIAQLRERYPTFDVRVFDICRDPFPLADVWHCRDCLFHLPFARIHEALSNFVRSEVPYALLTTHRAFLLHRNLDLSGIGFRFLDLERAPFHLPKPLVYLPDYKRGVEFPRYVGLWSREAIAEALRCWPAP